MAERRSPKPQITVRPCAFLLYMMFYYNSIKGQTYSYKSPEAIHQVLRGFCLSYLLGLSDNWYVGGLLVFAPRALS